MSAREHVRGLETLDSGDVGLVGGKNASLGEMTQHLREGGVRVPEGFATTAQAYWDFLEANALEEGIGRELNRLKDGEQTLSETGRAVRALFLESEFPEEISKAIVDAYRRLAERIGRKDPDVAVRSSAPPTSTSARLGCAVRRRAITRISPACWSRRGSTRCP